MVQSSIRFLSGACCFHGIASHCSGVHIASVDVENENISRHLGRHLHLECNKITGQFGVLQT